MGNPAKIFILFYFISCLSFVFAQENSTAIDSNLTVVKSRESETVNIIATVNPTEVAPTAYRFSVYPRNHPAEPFIQKLFFPGELIQIVLPLDILNTDTLGNVAKLEPLGGDYPIQYRMFNITFGEIKLPEFKIEIPSDIIKLFVVEIDAKQPISHCYVIVSQYGKILTEVETDSLGYCRLRIPSRRNLKEPVILSIDSQNRFPTWKGKIEIISGVQNKTIEISSLTLGDGETIYTTLEDRTPFREGPENGADLLFFLNAGDQVVISKSAGDRVYGRIRIHLEKQNKYTNIFGWVLSRYIRIQG